MANEIQGKVKRQYRRWTPEKINGAFFSMLDELRDIPSVKQFEERYGGAIAAIRNKRYDSEITDYTSFLHYLGMPSNYPYHKPYLEPEAVEAAFCEMKEELGRTPMQKEFFFKYPMVARTLRQDKYSPGVNSYRKFLNHLTEPLPSIERVFYKGHPEKVAEAFREFKSGGHKIRKDRFARLYPGAYSAMCKGEYDPKITSWNEFLKAMGEENIFEHKHQWTPEKIRSAYFDVKAKLGRIPASKEFGKYYGGALRAMSAGRYSKNITTWNGFLKSLEGRVLKEYDRPVDKDLVKRHYFDLRAELGRTPHANEFDNRFPQDFYAIHSRKFNRQIHTWNGFLMSLGEAITRRWKIGYDCEWNRDTLIDAYFLLKEIKKGKNPTARSFAEFYGPEPMAAIRQGKYDSSKRNFDLFAEAVNRQK
jgi:hypothetical protein